MSGEPLFSLIVPSCNVARYVGETLASFKRQTFADFEVLVTIETSTDGTEEACRAAIGDDARFSIVTLPRSGSASQCRNYGMTHARGEFLLFIDGDDWIDDDSLAHFAAIIAQHPEVELISSGMRQYRQNDDGSLTYLVGRDAYQGRPDMWYETGVQFLQSLDFMTYWIPGTCCFVYRRRLLTRAGLYQPVGRIHEDTAWTHRIAFKAGEVYVSPRCYCNYRRHVQSITHERGLLSIQSATANAKEILQQFEQGEYPSVMRREFARFICLNFMHNPFFLRKFAGILVTQRQTRASCCAGLREIFAESGAWGRYWRVCRAAGQAWPLFAPFVYAAQWRWLFPVAEYAYRLWHNRLWPWWKRRRVAKA